MVSSELTLIIKIAIVVVSLFFWLDIIFDFVGWIVSIPKYKIISAVKITIFIGVTIVLFAFFTSKGLGLLNLETHTLEENLFLIEDSNQ